MTRARRVKMIADLVEVPIVALVRKHQGGGVERMNDPGKEGLARAPLLRAARSRVDCVGCQAP